MINCHRGDVVLVLFPDSNLRTTKLRPALVVQNDNLASGLQQVIVAMITSNMLRLGPPSRVFVPVGTEATKNSGLLLDSIVMTDNLATIHDPLAFTLSPLTLFLAATIAAAWPAFRVLRTDPALTLRHD